MLRRSLPAALARERRRLTPRVPYVSAALTTSSRTVASGSNDKDTGAQNSGKARAPPPPWDPTRNEPSNKAVGEQRNAAAHTRLTQLFHEDKTRRELRVRGAGPASAQQHATTARLVFDDDNNDHAEVSEIGSSDTVQAAPSQRFLFGVDEDEGLTDGGLVPLPQSSLPAKAASPRLELQAMEQELLDDDFLFFPPAVVGQEADDRLGPVAAPGASSSPQDQRQQEQRRLKQMRERYVPGQQIIPPGLTRYRVEVQYQGSDFDGWYKTSRRRWDVVEHRADGTVARRRQPTPREVASAEGGTGVAAEGTQARHHARTILEDALAVALDVPSVSVVAAAIPETGVSVRRLTCHVDLPSQIEMQPRTILQRATMWLQSHQQPLAILACHPCKNQDFHARHSGVRRVYCYRILNRVAPPLFDAGLQWHVDRHLDVARMQRFAAAMEGTRDFGYFADPKMANALRRAAAGGCGQINSAPVFDSEHENLTATGHAPWERAPAPKVDIDRGLSNLDRAAALPTFNEYGQRVVTYDAKPREFLKARTNLPTVRTIDKIEVVRQEDEVLIWFVGKSFLRHQIRNMVSVLKASGHGLWDEQELQHALNAGFEVSRKKFKRERLPAAPAYGLTLWDVEYPRQHRDDYVPYVDSGPYEEVDISAIN